MRIAVLGTTVAALAIGSLMGASPVAMVHGHALGGPATGHSAYPDLPQGASR